MRFADYIQILIYHAAIWHHQGVLRYHVAIWHQQGVLSDTAAMEIGNSCHALMEKSCFFFSCNDLKDVCSILVIVEGIVSVPAGLGV